MTDTLDYPVANPPDIAPPVYRAMIIQAMAAEYLKAMQSSPEPFGMDEAFAAALATWDTDWATHDGPRTIEAGIDEALGDLAYWCED